MLRKVLGAVLALGFSTTSPMAAPTVPVFDGIFTFKADNNNCSGEGNAFPAVYRPQIKASDPKTGLVVIMYRAGAGFSLPGDGQFGGANKPFAGVQLTTSATVSDRSGVSTLTQNPTKVVSGTATVTLSGTFSPSDGGCRYVFKATFLRRPGT